MVRFMPNAEQTTTTIRRRDTNAQDGEGQSDHAVDELRHTNDQRKSTLIITKIKSMTDARGVS
jgi:hypothetical protein